MAPLLRNLLCSPCPPPHYSSLEFIILSLGFLVLHNTSIVHYSFSQCMTDAVLIPHPTLPPPPKKNRSWDKDSNAQHLTWDRTWGATSGRWEERRTYKGWGMEQVMPMDSGVHCKNTLRELSHWRARKLVHLSAELSASFLGGCFWNMNSLACLAPFKLWAKHTLSQRKFLGGKTWK